MYRLNNMENNENEKTNSLVYTKNNKQKPAMTISTDNS